MTGQPPSICLNSLFKPPKFLYQPPQLIGELIHGLLKTGQQIKRHDNGKTHSRNSGEYGLLHLFAPLWQELFIHNPQVHVFDCICPAPFSDKMKLRFNLSTIAVFCGRSLRGWVMEMFMVLPLSSQNIMISVFSTGQPSLCCQIAAIRTVNAMQWNGQQSRNGLGGKKQIFVGGVRIDL